MSRRLRRTKIVTTLGPATDRDNNLEKVIAAGANVIHMNSSHGSSEDHKIRADKVREVTVEPGRHVAILGDLQEPKTRVSTFKEGRVFFNIGDKFLLDANLGKNEDDKEKASIGYKGLPAGVVLGDILLLGDGRVQLRALEVQGMKMFTGVIVDGSLSSNEGIDKLSGGLSAEVPTKKGKADVKTAALIGVDRLAVFFPCRGEDSNCARRLAHDAGCDAKIVVKVERTEAACSQGAMDDIISASNVVMVARDSLGVGIGDPELVGIQKALIRRVRQLDRAVVAAIQMMESMITSPISTRAEVMDVANAVLDSTDAVMLSVKAAAGQYPSEAVAATACACLDAEKIPSINVSKYRLDVQFDSMGETIAMSAVRAASHLKGVTAITTVIGSNRTALMASRINSGLPIFAMSRHERMPNLTALYRDVTPVYFDSTNGGVTAASEAVNLLHDRGYLTFGDLVIVTRGGVMSTVGSTNAIRILTVE